MFEFPKRRGWRRNAALAGSFLFHVSVLVFLLHREPPFIKPSSMVAGQQGTSASLVYFAPRLQATDRPQRKLHFKRKNKPVAPPQPAVESARAGSVNGSLLNGPATGVEATPAIPLTFPDPKIYPWQLSGVQGDVVIEVTIDERGNVSETRLLASVKKEIDEKCIATLRNWHFRPAMVDGVAISSRQDVHFHFPS